MKHRRSRGVSYEALRKYLFFLGLGWIKFRSGTFLGSSGWLITLPGPSSLLFLTSMGWKLPANQMEMSQKLFLKDISIGFQPQLVTSLPHKKWPLWFHRHWDASHCPPACSGKLGKPFPCGSASISVVYSKKVFFPFCWQSKKSIILALLTVRAVFQAGQLHHCRAAHPSTTRLCCSSAAGVHSLH